MAEYAAGEETTPARMPMEEIPEDDDEDDEETKKKKNMEKTLWTRIFQGCAIASFVLCLAAMAIERSGVAIAMGLVGCIVAPVVFFYQMKLQDTDSLRQVQNALRKEVNRLQAENDTLSGQVDELGTTVDGLKASETKLEAIAQEQGSNVSSLVALVKENGEIVDEMDHLTRMETLQNLFDVMLQADTDQSFTIGKHEVDMLLLRLRIDPRVTVNEERFRAKVEAANDELPLLELIMDLEKPAGSEEERIFVVHALEGM